MHDYFCDRCCVYNNQECVLSLFFFCDRSCDKYGLGVIHPHEFRSGIEKRLGYPMSEKQWEQVKCDVGQDSDGLIPYNKFLQMFDVPYVSP